MACIVYTQDPFLIVHIDRANPAAPVTFEYLAFDDAPVQATQYQTADMPSDNQEAAAMINEYAENVAG